MLGNFSFGDYFKPQAIELAWTLITKQFGLNKSRLLVTVYHNDDEAFDLWKKIAGFADEPHHPHPDLRQLLGNGRHGAVRPVLGDLLRPGREPVRRPARQCRPGRRPVPRVLEPRFHAVRAGGPGERLSLPRPSIDTGMGLERMAAILQGVKSNYDTDLMRGPHPGRRLADRRRPGRAAAGEPPHHRRPPAGLRVPDRRRRRPVQRGARLRAAAHHASRHAACPVARGP